MKRHFVVLVSLFVLVWGAIAQEEAVATTRSTPPTSATFDLAILAEGFNRPLYVVEHPTNGALLVMEQGGKIHQLNPDNTRSLFLEVTDKLTWDVNAGGYTERGLLGLAFHPEFEQNGQFFINYTDKQGATVVARYFSDESQTPEILMTVPQPFPNHNGGHIAFGTDGYLYISLGDGGAANDPLGAGQNTDTLLGKILRIDVNTESGYAIPSDNPFVNGGGLPEIWAYGLRNAWRFSFDRATGDLYIADVGQNLWEEVNFQPADSNGGENYGWNQFEGTRVFRNSTNPISNHVPPIAEYEHSTPNGCSITGGYVYRGETIPDLQGAYLYSDYCSGRVWATYRDTTNTWQTVVLIDLGFGVSSFGEDSTGELYVIDYGGRLLKFIPR